MEKKVNKETNLKISVRHFDFNIVLKAIDSKTVRKKMEKSEKLSLVVCNWRRFSIKFLKRSQFD